MRFTGYTFRLAGRFLQKLLNTIPLIILSILLALPVQLARAHEISPSISDLTVNGNTIDFELRLNIESFVAGIDLQSVNNTDDTESGSEYDRFRALSSAQLESAFRDYWPEMSSRFSINAPMPLQLSLQRVSIPETGDIELPRESSIAISADLPSASPWVSISWPAEYGALVIRQQGVEEPYTGYLENGGDSEQITVAGGGEQTIAQTFWSYIPVGFDHIIPKGLDHILFVLGLFFLAARFKPLLWQISVFTLAHSITLALAALEWISVPASIVEPLIAASIVYVAFENLFTDKLHPWRTLVIFCFGLLHGLGFASVLAEFGLPVNRFIPALIGFNIGVEIGQLVVVAIAFFAIAIWCRNHPDYRKWIARPASVLIAMVGAWWFYERVFLA